MRDELVALAQLAKMDDSARDIDAELKQIPIHLEELRQSVQMLETMLAQERAQIAEAQQLHGAQKDELQERVEGLARARKKMAQASSIKEADAAEREVNANRRSIKEREDEVKRIQDAVEAKQNSLTERENDFEQAKTVLASEEEGSKGRLTELEGARGKLLGGREEIADKIPKNVLKRYERLRVGIPNLVAIINSSTCVGCRMALPPQLFIELQRADKVHDCPHCRRFVIHEDVVAGMLDDGEPAAPEMAEVGAEDGVVAGAAGEGSEAESANV